MFNKFVLFGLVGIMPILIILVLVLALAFEIAMFVSVVRNTRISDNRKILWIIGMLLVHPFIAVAYYATDRKA